MTRNPLLLGAVLIVLVGLIILLARPSGEKEEADTSALFAGLDTAGVDLISIRDAGTFTELKRENDKWVIATDRDFPADPDGVSSILQATARLSGEDVASRKAEKYGRFEVDSATAAEVSIGASGERIGRFFLGKEGPDRSSQYVRVAGRPEVFRQTGRLKAIFVRAGDAWRDKTILRVESDEIETIELIRGEERFLFQSDLEGEWSVIEPEGFEPVKALVVAMARVMTRLTASGFPEEGEDGVSGFVEPEAAVTVTLFNGSTYSIEVGSERDGKPGWFVRRAGDDIIYVVASSRINNFIRATGELMTPAVADSVGSQPAESGGE